MCVVINKLIKYSKIIIYTIYVHYKIVPYTSAASEGIIESTNIRLKRHRNKRNESNDINNITLTELLLYVKKNFTGILYQI